MGVDLGSSGIRIAAYDDSGVTVGQAAVTYAARQRSPGTMIQDPQHDWRAGFAAAAHRVTKQMTGHHLAGIGLSGLFPAISLVTATGNPLTEAILYGDRRSEAYKHAVESILGRTIPTDSMSPHLLRLRQERGALFDEAAWILSPAATVGLWLTGETAVDPQTALRWGGLVAADRGGWDQGAVEALGLRMAQLPPIRAATSLLGRLTRQAAEWTGLPVGTPVSVGPTDSLATVLAAGAHHHGQLIVSYSSSGVVLRNKMPVQAALDADLLRLQDHPYEILAYLFHSGSAVEHVRTTLARGASYPVLNSQAGTSSGEPSGIAMLPTGRVGTDNSQRSFATYAMAGMTDHTSSGDLWRAALESFPFAVRHTVSLTGEGEVFAAGGGAENDLWRQITTDVLEKRQKYFERCATTLGAAAVVAQAVAQAASATKIVQRWLSLGGSRFAEPRDDSVAEYQERRSRWDELFMVAARTRAHR